MNGPGNQTDGQVSPDGRLLAYTSDHDGRREIYVCDLRSGSRRRISAAGGDISRWRSDGRELFYLAGPILMSVAVSATSLEIGVPVRLFTAPLPASDSLGELGAAATFGVAPDGSRFLLPIPDRTATTAIRVRPHWRPIPPS